MGKNIVLLSDGTGQSGGVGYETNIWRLYRALAHDDQQLCCYDDGVGSQDLKLIRAVGGAFGWGLSRNVRDLYAFVVRHWEPGDRIYLFGFSRGAFTVRLLTGLIAHCGILDLSQIDSEERLDRLLRAAYCAIRRSTFDPQFTERFRQVHARKDTGPAGDGRVPVHFVGVWDTVDAMGVPFDELRDAFDKVLRYSFRDRVLSGQVSHACHALALDDTRRTFHPVMWDERLEPTAGRIEQVWFAGVHSNVGGGYPKAQMALVSLAWMLERALAFDQSQIANPAERLRLQPAALAEIHRGADVNGRLYDSRSGLAAIYRYAPRDLEEVRREYTEGDLVVHESAMRRIDRATDRYAPSNLTKRSPQLAGVPSPTDDWCRAMGHCWSIVWLRRAIYVMVLVSVALLLFREVGSLAGGLPKWMPSRLNELLSAPWARWGPLILIPLLLILRQGLKDWQVRLANAGWATLFPQHRPSGKVEIARADRSFWLGLADAIRTSNSAAVIATMSRGLVVRLLALILFLPLRLGRQIHSAWCFRGLERARLAEPIHLSVGEARTLVFETRDLSFVTGVWAVAGERYDIRVEKWSGWADAQYQTDPAGLPPERIPALVRLAKPLFRRPDLAVFALLAQVKGSSPVQIGQGAEIQPSVSGDLQLFVNDADLRIPLFRDIFYCNNRGVARIRIERLS